MTDLAAQVGDSFQHSFRLLETDANGIATARSLGGAAIVAVIRRGPHAASDLAPDNFLPTISNAAEGVATISLPATHTLPAGDYWYEVDATFADGNRETILDGRLTVRPSLFR